MFGVSRSTLDAPAAAVECIHAYSLMHDDLPAMDDDDLRRGQPTCHIKFGEANAILAGDALQTLAFSILSDTPMPEVPDRDRLAMVSELAQLAASPECAAVRRWISRRKVNRSIYRHWSEFTATRPERLFARRFVLAH